VRTSASEEPLFSLVRKMFTLDKSPLPDCGPLLWTTSNKTSLHCSHCILQFVPFIKVKTFLGFSFFTVTILISAINNDNFNQKDTVVYQCICNTNFTYYKLCSFVSDRNCQLCFLYCYFRNVYIILNYYTASKLFFKIMKQSAIFAQLITCR